MNEDKELEEAIRTVLQALEKLQNHCKEMIKEKQELTSALLDNIPKKKIEDKLKQLNSEMQYCARQNGKTIKLGKIMALQELLEDK